MVESDMELSQKLTEYLEAFEKAAIDLAPQALDLALAITRYESLGEIVLGVVLFLAAFGFALVIKWGLSGMHEHTYDGEFQHVLAVTFGSVGGLITTGIGIALLFNIWNWVGVFAPQIKLAKDVLDKVVGQ